MHKYTDIPRGTPEIGESSCDSIFEESFLMDSFCSCSDLCGNALFIGIFFSERQSDGNPLAGAHFDEKVKG